MDGKWDKWWLAPVFALAIVLVQMRLHWRSVLAFIVVLTLTLLAGCGATLPQLVEIKVPLPIACQVAEPARPALAIDSMPPDLPIDVQARNLRADHDVRDGYESELRAALQACKASVPATPPGAKP